MSYYAYDSKGYVGDVASIAGWNSFVMWATSKGGDVHAFVTAGHAEPKALAVALNESTTIGDAESVRRNIATLATRARDVLIVSDWGKGESGTEVQKRAAPLLPAGHTTLSVVSRDRLKGRMLRAQLEKQVTEFFETIREPIVKSVVAACESILKADQGALSQVDSVMGLVDISVLGNLPPRIQNLLAGIYADAGKQAIKISSAGAGVAVHPRSDAFKQVHEDALEYAKIHSAGLVGMHYNDDGDLEENLNTEAETGDVYAITEKTREGIRSDVERVVSGDLPITKLSDTLRESYGLSDTRASMIARTEYNRANGEGALSGLIANGVKLKRWMTSNDDDVTPDCDANQEQGPIPVDEEFQSGAMTDPDHPNCRCNVAGVVKLGGDSDDDTE